LAAGRRLQQQRWFVVWHALGPDAERVLFSADHFDQRSAHYGGAPEPALRSHVGPVIPDKHHELNGLFQYVSNFYNSELVQFDYPKGNPLSREIFSDEPQGECGNALYGVAERDFWVAASGADEIEEFALGGTGPIKTIVVPIELHFIAPGKPTQNPSIESLNGKIRDELFNMHRFTTIFEARRRADEWKTDYNEVRPHSALGYQTPKEFAEAFKINPTSQLSAA
jgi:transposase InsO family protein